MVMSNAQDSEVDIVVPVFNAASYALRCLGLVCKRSGDVGFRLIIVNDGSDVETGELLREFAERNDECVLLEHQQNRGYTRAINTGLAYSTAPFVVLLNSDTEVSDGWLRKLLECFETDNQLGIVGPLSNAASWQSVPRLFDESGRFYINSLPENTDVNKMALIIDKISLRHYPQVTFVNGFCFMIRRAVIDSIGCMDEEAFPLGYGEENDYCLRAKHAGFKLVIADDVYVYHAKSKSFGHKQREKLSAEGSMALRRKHGELYFNEQAQRMRDILPLNAFRQRLENCLSKLSVEKEIAVSTIKVLFVLPSPGVGGGSHSVVQEVSAMRGMGVDAAIAVEHRHLHVLYDRYPEIENIKDLFVGYTSEDLLEKARRYDVVIATIFHSTNLVKYISDAYPHILPAYYVQDYEPLFFNRSYKLYDDAFNSYNRLASGLLFAKTYWIAREVEKHHGVAVSKVVPSIDHTIYYPQKGTADPLSQATHIGAMIRPSTPRRGAARTMQLLSQIKKRYGKHVRVHLFGCEENEVEQLTNDFDYKHYGILQRSGVASLLRKIDVFVDLSDYQAFGRTSLEAMACGATAMVPADGGGDEYAIDGKNALVVDSFDLEVCEERLAELIDDPIMLAGFKTEALITSKNFSPEKAAQSELDLIQTALTIHRQQFPLPDHRSKLYILNDNKMLPAQMFEESQFAHLLWRITILTNVSQLPVSGGGVLITRGTLSATDQENLSVWHESWVASGGIWLHELAELQSLEVPIMQWVLKKIHYAIVLPSDGCDKIKSANSKVILVSSEFNYLEVIRTSLFFHREKMHLDLASSTIETDLSNMPTEAALRRQRLWFKFRTDPRRYFADSKVIGLPYLQYIFRK